MIKITLSNRVIRNNPTEKLCHCLNDMCVMILLSISLMYLCVNNYLHVTGHGVY